MSQSFGKFKHKILNRLSTATVLIPLKDLIDEFRRDGTYEGTVRQALAACKDEQLIDCNVNGAWFITRTGREVVDVLNKKTVKKKHTFNGTLRCERCGLNRKTPTGYLYWYDGGDPVSISPPCK